MHSSAGRVKARAPAVLVWRHLAYMQARHQTFPTDGRHKFKNHLRPSSQINLCAGYKSGNRYPATNVGKASLTGPFGMLETSSPSSSS